MNTVSSYLPKLTKGDRKVVSIARRLQHCCRRGTCITCDAARLLIKLVDRAIKLDATKMRVK